MARGRPPPPPPSKRKLPPPATHKPTSSNVRIRQMLVKWYSIAMHPRIICIGVVMSIILLSSYWRLLFPHSRNLVAEARKRNSIQMIHPDTKVVLALTSFPNRLETIEETIKSLMEQSRPVDVVYLTVPNQVKRLDGIPQTMPPIVDELQGKYGKKLVVQRTEDYGPATKLLGALLVEKDPDTVIITVDDDVTYHPDTVLGLVEIMHKFPGFAPTYKCEIFPWWWFTAIAQVSEGPCKGFVNAYKAVAYKVKYFANGAVFDHSKAPKGCRIHDDVWISGSLYKVGVRPFVVKADFDSVVNHRPWNNFSIHAVPKGESDFRNPCITYFNNFV